MGECAAVAVGEEQAEGEQRWVSSGDDADGGEYRHHRRDVGAARGKEVAHRDAHKEDDDGGQRAVFGAEEGEFFAEEL